MISAAQLVAMVVGGVTGEPGWAASACRVFMVLVRGRRMLMGGHRFDALARRLSTTGSRRAALRALAASLVTFRLH
jgi:hypothetical protein